jgi:hypothetical protein
MTNPALIGVTISIVIWDDDSLTPPCLKNTGLVTLLQAAQEPWGLLHGRATFLRGPPARLLHHELCSPASSQPLLCIRPKPPSQSLPMLLPSLNAQASAGTSPLLRVPFHTTAFSPSRSFSVPCLQEVFPDVLYNTSCGL